MMYERMDCRLCGGRVQTVLPLTPTPIANLFPDEPLSGKFYPLELKQCHVCSHVQVGHVIDDDTLYGIGYKYVTPEALRPQINARAAELRQEYGSFRNVLEIGSNNGLFLHALRDAGFKEVIGIDPSSTDPLVWKMPFSPRSAELIKRRVGTVDLIVANNVFAHIDNLKQVFSGIDTILSPDGAVVFEVQYLVPMMASGAFDMIYHEHRDYHTLWPLQAFLAGAGMVMTAWEVIDAHGGSIRVTAKRYGVQKEAPKEILNWGTFEAAILHQRSWVNAQFSGKIAAFGAPAKAVTLIHHFGLQYRISYCVDDTPQKQGKYIAGTAIPVVSRDVMMTDKPRQMLLLSWNYERLVRESLPNVDFIVPFSPRLSKAA